MPAFSPSFTPSPSSWELSRGRGWLRSALEDQLTTRIPSSDREKSFQPDSGGGGVDEGTGRARASGGGGWAGAKVEQGDGMGVRENCGLVSLGGGPGFDYVGVALVRDFLGFGLGRCDSSSTSADMVGHALAHPPRHPSLSSPTPCLSSLLRDTPSCLPARPLPHSTQGLSRVA